MPIVAPILIGAAIGAATALVTGQKVGKGALFGAIGGGISAAFGAGAQAISGAGEVVGGASATAGSVGADAAASTAGTMAENLVGQTVVEGTTGLGAAAGEVIPGAASNASIAVPASEIGGTVANLVNGTPVDTALNAGAGAFEAGGVGPLGSPSAIAAGMGGVTAPSGIINKSMFAKAMEWADANPQLAAGILQGGGFAVAGIGQGAGDYLTAGRKAELELENQKKLMQYYRDFVQGNRSIGGGGVNLGVSASGTPRTLRRISTGGAVHSGIINGAM